MEKFLPAPKLRDVVKKLIDADITQPKIARAIYGLETKQGKISYMLNATDASTWEKHWQVFAKFIPFAIDTGVITVQDLLGLPPHGSTQDHGGAKTRRPKTDSR